MQSPSSMLCVVSAPLASPTLRCSRRNLRDASFMSTSLHRRSRCSRGAVDRTAPCYKVSISASAVFADGVAAVAAVVVGAAALDRKKRQQQQRQHQRRRSVVIAAAAAAAPSNADDDLSSGGESEPDSGSDPELELEAEDCKVGFVTVDNASSRSCTLLRLEAADYLGLIRVVAWVLGGLGLTVRDARLTTGEDGWVRNEFWVTTESGKKLSDARAAAASERLAEFVTYCTPPPRKQGQEPRVESGGITVDSTERAHAKWTVVTVRGGGVSSGGSGGGGFGGASGRVGAISSFGPSGSSSFSSSSYSSSSPLLDVASAVSGAGIAIREAIVMGGGPSCEAGNDDEASSDVVDGVGVGVGRGRGRPTIDDDPEEGEASSSSSSTNSSSGNSSNEPAMRLWVCEPATGGKLSYVRCAALLQTLSLALGRGGGPSLVPPVPVELRKFS